MATFDSLYNNFDIITKGILERRDKLINKMQQIFASAKTKFIRKQATEIIEDLAIKSKSRNSTAEKRASSNNKRFICGKLEY